MQAHKHTKTCYNSKQTQDKSKGMERTVTCVIGIPCPFYCG